MIPTMIISGLIGLGSLLLFVVRAEWGTWVGAVLLLLGVLVWIWNRHHQRKVIGE